MFKLHHIYVSTVEEQSLLSHYVVGEEMAVAAATQQRDQQILLSSKWSGNKWSHLRCSLTETA